jgi:hypothetical protein
MRPIRSFAARAAAAAVLATAAALGTAVPASAAPCDRSAHAHRLVPTHIADGMREHRAICVSCLDAL